MEQAKKALVEDKDNIVLFTTTEEFKQLHEETKKVQFAADIKPRTPDGALLPPTQEMGMMCNTWIGDIGASCLIMNNEEVHAIRQLQKRARFA